VAVAGAVAEEAAAGADAAGATEAAGATAAGVEVCALATAPPQRIMNTLALAARNTERGKNFMGKKPGLKAGGKG